MINREHKNWNNFWLGLVVVVLPFLGLPLGFKKIVLALAGLLVMLFSLARLPDRPARQKDETLA